MNWNQITITVPTKLIDEACAIAQMVVPYGLHIEDYSDVEEFAPQIAHVDLIDEELLNKDKTSAKIHIYVPDNENPLEAISFLKERFDSVGLEFSIDKCLVDDVDWGEAWKKYYHPMRIGKNLIVCPSWENYQKQQDDIIINLDPGMAFGSGSHETTKLCLTFLEDIINSNTSVLDVGCGSGILAISSVLLGASSAVGCDIDNVAVRVACENAQLNKVSDKATFVKADLTSGLSGKYDIICANIVADIIIKLVPDLDKFLNDNGYFIASGIIDSRENDVISILENYGFYVEKRLENGSWVALQCRKSNS